MTFGKSSEVTCLCGFFLTPFPSTLKYLTLPPGSSQHLTAAVYLEHTLCLGGNNGHKKLKTCKGVNIVSTTELTFLRKVQLLGDNLNLCVCVCGVFMCGSENNFTSLLPSCGFWGSSSGYQDWQQPPLLQSHLASPVWKNFKCKLCMSALRFHE